MDKKHVINNKTIIGIIAICFSASLWGLDGVVLTPRLHNINVSTVVFMIHIIPFLFMSIFMSEEFKKIKEFTKSDFIFFSLTALFGGVIGTIAIVKALFLVNFNSLSIIVLLQKLQPVFAIILAYIVLKERVSKDKYFWAAIAVIASYFLAFGFSVPTLLNDSNLIYASALSLLAAFSFGSSTVFSKKILEKYDFKTATFYRFLFSSIIILLYITIFNQKFIPQILTLTQNNIIIILIISLTTGSGAIFLYYFGLKRVKATISTICELCFPISAILLDYFINNKLLTVPQILAVIVISFSIYKISRRNTTIK